MCTSSRVARDSAFISLDIDVLAEHFHRMRLKAQPLLQRFLECEDEKQRSVLEAELGCYLVQFHFDVSCKLGLIEELT